MQNQATICVILLGYGMFTGCRSGRQGGGGPEPGMDFFAVAPETVVEVLYSSPDRKLYAFRWSTTGPFQVVVAQRDATPEQCTGGDGFTRWLRAITRVPVSREVEKGVDASKGEWAHIQIQDTSQLEPNEIDIRVPSLNSEPVVMRVARRQFVIDVDQSALQSIRSGCAVLGSMH